MHMSNLFHSTLEINCLGILIPAVSSSIHTIDSTISIFFIFCTFTFSAIYFLWCHSFTCFSSSHLLEMLSSPTPNVFTNGMEISDDDDIQSVYLSLCQNMDKKFSTQHLFFWQYSSKEVFISIDHVKSARSVLHDICRGRSKELTESMTGSARTTALEWCLNSFCLLSIK